MPPHPDPVLTPVEWSAKGEAIAWPEGPGRHKVLVFGGIPDEQARVRVVHRGRHQSHVRFVEAVDRPHPNRRRAPCDRFFLCGGCPVMHLDPPGQERFRLHRVRRALDEVGLADLAPEGVWTAAEWDYRHVVKLGVGRSERGRLRVGAFARNTRDVVPVPDCPVVTPELREVMRAVARQVIEMDVFPYDPRTGRGVLRYVVMRQSRATGHVLVTLVAGRSSRLLRALAGRIQEAHAAVVGVQLHLNDTEGNAIFADPEGEGAGFTRLAGQSTIQERLLDVRLEVGAGDFFQANPVVADRMAADILDAVADLRDRPVVDLYSGVGGFALVLAKAHGFAIGIERFPGAVARARSNARLNHLDAEFLAGPSAELLPRVAARVRGSGPVVVVDPARRGLERGVVEGILGLEPAALVYVSCGPRSLARDLAGFVEAGWKPRRIRAYDMFPQTAHVELLTVLDPPRPPELTRRRPRRRRVRPA